MGYLGADFPFGQVAASMHPPTKARKAPAHAMKMAEPNSYLRKRGNSKSEGSRDASRTSANTRAQYSTRRMGYLLGIDRSERIVECLDDVMRIPRTGDNATQSYMKTKKHSETGSSENEEEIITIRKCLLTSNQDNDASSHSNA